MAIHRKALVKHDALEDHSTYDCFHKGQMFAIATGASCKNMIANSDDPKTLSFRLVAKGAV